MLNILSRLSKLFFEETTFLSSQCILSNYKPLQGVYQPFMNEFSKDVELKKGVKIARIWDLTRSKLDSDINGTLVTLIAQAGSKKRLSFEVQKKITVLADTVDLLTLFIKTHKPFGDSEQLKSNSYKPLDAQTSQMVILMGLGMGAYCHRLFAELKQLQVMERMFEGAAKMVESEFYQINGQDSEEYKRQLKHFLSLSGGHLFATGCESAVELYHANAKVQKAAHDLGMSIFYLSGFKNVSWTNDLPKWIFKARAAFLKDCQTEAFQALEKFWETPAKQKLVALLNRLYTSANSINNQGYKDRM